MTRRDLPNNERLRQRLVERATEGLDESAAMELLAALNGVDDESIDLTAAALDVHWTNESSAEIPASLKAKLAVDAERHFADRQFRDSTIPISTADSASAASSRGASMLGWFVAAAAIVIAVIAWMPQPKPEIKTIAQERNELIDEYRQGDLVQLAWSGLDQPGFETVSGDVVWSDVAQRGYMRFSGMPINDPSQSQYQLWIVDPDVDQHPVDGGIFDVNKETGELIIPIDAKLKVSKPVAFVITEERPGGVVVSDGPHLVIAARQS